MGRRQAVAWACLLWALTGCGFDLGDIDRTQPNKIPKMIFQGDWYFRQTVMDVPYTTSLTFAGEQNDPTELIRWDIQEHFLIAYRANDIVAGTDQGSVLPGDSRNFVPVATFPIDSHFDVQREYNAQTGEQTNVISENTTDRPWHDRKYMRVDWSVNLAAGFNFIVDSMKQEPGSHYVSLPGDPDALLIARKVDGKWEDRQGDSIASLEDAQYIDVVHRIMLTPETIQVEDEYGTVYTDPACWYYGSADCAAAEVKVRSAFLKREASSYVPWQYPDNAILRDETGKPITVSYKDRDSLEPDPLGFTARAPYFDKFGYFRTERDAYDRRHGETNTGRILLINRFNIWENTPGCINSTSETPYAGCTVKPIVYHTSANFPAPMLDAARRTTQQWNDAFKETVRTLKYGNARPLAEVEDVFIMKENTFRRDGDRIVDRGQRIGDLRYNFFYWVDEPNQAGLLGYGPSTNDPLTGETISASAFVYGAAVDTLAQRARDVIDLINDPSKLTVDLEGEDVMRDVLLRRATDSNAREDTRRFIREKLGTERQATIKRLGKRAFRTDGSRTRAKLDAMKDTTLESRLVTDPVIRLFNHGRVPDALSDAQKRAFSPRSWAMGRREAREKQRHLRLAQRRAEPMNFFDTSVIGLARAYKDADPETVYQQLRADIFRSTLEHEVGHTLGLRHNFEATTDALNFGREYWDLRGEDGHALDQLTQAQIDGRMREHQYSSIMDYGSRFMSDIAGVGSYDKAAIAFGYGELVEIFEGRTTVDEPLLYLGDLPMILKHMRHYTKLPGIFGGIDGMHRRSLVPYSRIVDQLAGRADWTTWEVPYRFCSDEYDGTSATCATFDEGADAYEIAAAARSLYRDYIPFLAYARDRREFDEWEYMDRIDSRSLRPMLTQYQNWVWDSWNWESAWECARTNAAGCDNPGAAAYFHIEDKAYNEAEDAGLPGAAATRLLLDELAAMTAMPEPGSYKFDTAQDVLSLYWYGDVARCPNGRPAPDCSDAIVPWGVGRATQSEWDFASGYYFYDRLKSVGSFYDKLVALQTAITSDTAFLGIDVGANGAHYLIGLSMYFPEEVYRLMGGAATEDYRTFSGVACDSDGHYEAPILSQNTPNYCSGGTYKYVDPATSFTVELYSIWLGMAFLPQAFDTTFNDRMKIWLEGSGEQFTPVSDALVTSFHNPLNNRTYKASCVTGVGTYSPYCPASALLRRAQSYADLYTAAPIDENRWRLDNLMSTIEDIRGTFDVYGYLFW